jgi:hypothetical protein
MQLRPPHFHDQRGPPLRGVPSRGFLASMTGVIDTLSDRIKLYSGCSSDGFN